MGFTDDCYTDGRDPSVTPSVLLLPTECITVTDGISPSAKLYNVVVLETEKPRTLGSTSYPRELGADA